MSEPQAKAKRNLLQITPDDSLPEVLTRLRGYAGKSVALEIPDHSPILLTATEFRTLKDAAERSQIDLSLQTSDSLRLQLASMFDLVEGVSISRRGKQASSGGGDLITTTAGWRIAPDDAQADDNDPISISRRRRSSMEKTRRDDALPRRSRTTGTEPDSPSGTLDYLDPEASGGHLDAQLLGRIVAILAVIVLVAGVAGWYYMPQVTIAATLKEQAVSGDLVYAVGLPTATLPSDVQFTIEAQEASAEVNIELSVPASGVRTEPGDTASGSVVLRNPTAAAIAVPAGTEVQTAQGVAFATQTAVDVPATSGSTPGEARADVQALEPGGTGNIELGALTGKIDGLDVYFSNREGAISGGTDREIRSVTEEDLTTLEQTLTDQLQRVTADGWSKQLPAGESIVGPSVVPGEPTYEIQQDVGDEIDQVTLTGTVEATGLVFAMEDIERELRQAFEGQLQATVADGYRLLPNTIALGESDVITESPNAVIYRLSATATTQAIFDEAARDDLIEQIAGGGYDEANALVTSQPAFETSTLEISPGFWPERMPQAADRITLEIAPGSEQTPVGNSTPDVSPSPESSP